MADEQLTPIMFARFADEFSDLQWSMFLGGPFEVTNPLQAMVMEAGAKGCGIVIQVALVPIETLFPELGEEPVEDEFTETPEE